MLLAWKNAHRFELSTFLLMASVWAPLPSVSDSARNSAITAISSAIFLFSPEASLAWSACSMLSCALIVVSLPETPTSDRTNPPAQGASGCDGRVIKAESKPVSGARMRDAVDFEQPLGVDAGVNLGGRQRGVAEQFLDRAQIAAAGQKMGREGVPQRMRRRAVGQAERAAQPFHGELDESCLQRL